MRTHRPQSRHHHHRRHRRRKHPRHPRREHHRPRTQHGAAWLYIFFWVFFVLDFLCLTMQDMPIWSTTAMVPFHGLYSSTCRPHCTHMPSTVQGASIHGSTYRSWRPLRHVVGAEDHGPIHCRTMASVLAQPKASHEPMHQHGPEPMHQHGLESAHFGPACGCHCPKP